MIKSLLRLLLALVAVAIAVALHFRSDTEVTRSSAEPWPAGMGTLDSVAARFPPLEQNATATQWLALAGALPTNGNVLEYLRREIARDDLAIGEPPALADPTAIRELLLREPIVFGSAIAFDDGEIATRRVVLLTAARTLVADALARAYKGDATAWEDLHAAWILARTQDGHPQMMAQTAALTMARWINAVAWKMPLPAPEWLHELTMHDPVRPLLDAFQYQTASYWRSGSEIFPTRWLAQSMDRDRKIAEELANSNACDVEARENDLGPSLVTVWRRAFRFRAEREATANAIRVREGKPIEATSKWSDGGWRLDGTTLRPQREIPMDAEQMPMPLTLRIAR